MLKVDEQVIINGLQRVRPGVTVDPKPGEMAPKASASTASATDPKTLTSQATEEK